MVQPRSLRSCSCTHRSEAAMEAREELNALLSRETPTEIDAAVQSWARLSSARLHFEMDSLEDATRDYQAIERESPHFAESIHELAQTQVRYAEKQTDIGQRRKAFGVRSRDPRASLYSRGRRTNNRRSADAQSIHFPFDSAKLMTQS